MPKFGHVYFIQHALPWGNTNCKRRGLIRVPGTDQRRDSLHSGHAQAQGVHANSRDAKQLPPEAVYFNVCHGSCMASAKTMKWLSGMSLE